MTAGYVESPVGRVTEVGWPTVELTARVTDTPNVRQISFAEHDPDTGLVVGPIRDPSFWQAVIRGVDSGAEIDYRNISIEVFGFAPTPTPTSCDNTPSNHYNVPSGTAATDGDVPGLMGYISGLEGSSEFATAALLSSYRRLDYNAGVGLCNIVTAPTALPAFIDGEAITVSPT